MRSIGELEASEEVQEQVESCVIPKGCRVKEKTPLHISTSQRGLLGDEKGKKGFLFPKFDMPNYNLASPSAKFRQIAEGRDEVSRSVPSSTIHGLKERLSMQFREMSWDSLRKISKQWIRNPMNIALLVWVICVAVSGAILFMVMIGMLNHVLPRKHQRNAWFEVNNQILNALFTLMCLYQHPKRIYHLALLCRWRPEDISRLRKIYCKDGTYKPHEWGHMMVVVVLLNLNCFAQYSLCSLNLIYRRSERPAIGVGISITVAIASAAFAGLYTILSPLDKDYEPYIDQEAQDQLIGAHVDKPSNIRAKSLEKRFSFASRDNQRVVENRSEWSGGLFDLWDDISLAYLTLFCSFCVFGWNMERLGFGNMYVHIATFLLFCTAPFFIFNLAAINIDNEVVQEVLGITGIVLCIFGFLYGGFWRIQMRKRFNLPANYFCCGYPAVTDCVQWLFCCWCSLAQEVRTGNVYDIVEDKFYSKEMRESDRPVLTPLSRENSFVQLRLSQGSPLLSSSSPSKPGPGVINSPSPRRDSNGYETPNRHVPISVEGSSTGVEDRTMTPPSPLLIQREGDQQS